MAGTSGVSFGELVQYLGAPGAIMAVVTFAWIKGYIVTARECNHREKMLRDAIADRDRQNQHLRAEKDLWQQHSIENMKLLSKSTDITAMAVSKVPKEDCEGEGGGGGERKRGVIKP